MAESGHGATWSEVKTCTKCGEAKPLEAFPRDKSRPGGRFPHCKSCNKERASNWYSENTERGKMNAAMRRAKKPEEIKAYLVSWRVCNPEKIVGYRAKADPKAARERSRAWARANPDKVRERSARRREDPKFRLENSFRIAVCNCIRRGSKKSPTFEALGYTPDELRSHLERKFTDGMSWENYGRGGWHVDHILPLSSFSFETQNCPDFKMAFALSNLQPLWEWDNCSKRDRLDHPSQVGLIN